MLAAFINAVLLLVAMGSLGWEALARLSAPESTEGWTVIGVATVGIVINSATALLFMRGRGNDLNIRGAFLHTAADALVSVGVVAGGVLYLWKGWAWLDPVMRLGIAIVIIAGTARLFKQSLHWLFDGVPSDIRLEDVRKLLLGLPGVTGIHVFMSMRQAVMPPCMPAGAFVRAAVLLDVRVPKALSSGRVDQWGIVVQCAFRKWQ